MLGAMGAGLSVGAGVCAEAVGVGVATGLSVLLGGGMNTATTAIVTVHQHRPRIGHAGHVTLPPQKPVLGYRPDLDGSATLILEAFRSRNDSHLTYAAGPGEYLEDHPVC